MLGGGGIKAAAKRTAFGDVSNTFAGARPSKDDSTIPTKPGLQVAGKPLQAIQERRSAAFLRPAQRPLSVSSLKGLLTGVTGVAGSDSTTRQTGAEIGPIPQSANTRKVLTKRNTTIFKDSSLDAVQEIAIEAPSHHITLSSTAAPLQTVSRPIPLLQPLTKAVTTSKDPVKELRKPSSEIAHVEVSEATVDTAAVSSETENAAVAKSDGIYIDDKGVLRAYEEHVADIQEIERPVAVKLAKQVQPAPAKLEAHEMAAANPAVPVHVLQPIVSRYPQPAPSEAEEYWDEDEEDNYDEEGYVTARSYRSKGENTTGGATTVLFPHANQKVKREIAAAKELVEATRTAEEIEDECYDTSMVAEYGDEIFDYMNQLEVSSLLPLPVLPC
jgi:G2/mitotic-specific cyclin 3/4